MLRFQGPHRWAGPALPEVAGLGNAAFVDLAYQVVLGRHAEPSALAGFTEQLDLWKTTRYRLITKLVESEEFEGLIWDGLEFWVTQHRARLIVAAMLPKAETIVDLGGSCEGRPEGALVEFGYPYRFQSLSIVELPRDRRHELYTEICGEYTEVIETDNGPVSYVYASMTDLSAFGDATVDLVYAGQSIEHVTPEEAVTVFREVRRVLKPGGHFCFDTPNRAVTRLDNPDKFVVDDHKVEYTHPEMSALIEGNGFAVVEAKGLVLMSQSVEEGRFIPREVSGRGRIYDDIENCWLLYYKCRKV
jgi:hypothetical protein